MRFVDILAKTVFVVAVTTMSYPARAQSWTCSAPELISGSYDGGDTAYLHFPGHSRGSYYPVRKNGKRATGVTKRGKAFVCSQK